MRPTTFLLGGLVLAALVLSLHLLAPLGGERVPELAPVDHASPPAARDAHVSPVARREPPAPPALDPPAPAPADAPLAPDEHASLLARTTAELSLLDKQQPEAFLDAVIPPSTHPDFDPASAARARQHVRAYIADRTDVLRTMSLAYVQSGGAYDFQPDLDHLAQIDEQYRLDVADLEPRLPQISLIPDVLGQTALPVPTFAREAERLARGENLVEFEDNHPQQHGEER